MSKKLFQVPLLVLVLPLGVSAQEGRDVERLQVTGSHISRIDVEGPSPIQIIDRDALDQTGYNSVSDVLRDITSSSFGGIRESSGTSASGVASVSLRGLGADRTLVLLNGKRLPADPITGAVDLNLIPMAAVERIEVLKDGASATYGSDALAGVVNIITRNDFVGTEISVKTSRNRFEGGERTDVSLVNSTIGSRGQVITVFNYRNNDRIKSKDRPWAAEGRSFVASPANARSIKNVPNADNQPGPLFPSRDATGVSGPDSVGDPRCASEDLRSGLCSYKFADIMDEVPKIEQFSMLSQLNYEITPDVTFYARLMASRSENLWQFAPNAANFTLVRDESLDPNDIKFGVTPDIIHLDTARFEAIAASGGFAGHQTFQRDGDGNIITDSNQRRLLEEVPWGDQDSLFLANRLVPSGPRIQQGTTQTVGVQTGFKGYLFDTWSWDVSYDYNKLSRMNLSTNGYGLASRLADTLGTGTDQYNPLVPRSSDADVLQKGNVFYQPWNDSQAESHYINAVMSGELFDLAGRPLAAAFGASMLNEEYYNRNDLFTEAGDVLGGASSSGGGSRTVLSGYTELAYNPIDSLEVQLAGRFDSYNDFGSTVNPKAGFRFQLTPQIMTRGSVGTGFKAPTLTELHLAQVEGYPFFKDEYACEVVAGGNRNADACQSQQFRVLRGGNPDLKEEKSFSYNLGAMYQITRFTNLGFDFWGINLKDTIGIDLNKVTLAEKRGIDVTQFGIETTRSQDGELISMKALNQNLSTLKLQGIDITFSHRLRWDVLGDFIFNVEHAQLFFYKFEAFPGLGEEDLLGEFGRPKWRNNVTLGFIPSILPGYSLQLTAKTVGKHEKSNPTGGELERYTEFDLQMNYRTPWNGTFTFGVINLFNSTPPIDDSGQNNIFVDSLYNPFGQSAYLQYSQRF